MSDERSERLRQRRKQSKDKAQDSDESETDKPSKLDETSEPEKPSKPSKPDQPDKQDETDERDEQSESVKEEQVGTYMYLPKSQKKDLERVYNILKAEYEYEFDEEFEKNRSFYPLVVEYGLDSLDGLDATEIKDRLDSL
jgi:hypothetical protein